MKLTEAPNCPYCGQKMKKTETPRFNLSDGLGWCTPYLYVCFNDECSFYVQGWTQIMNNYGKVASYRCIYYPETGDMDTICVYTSDGLRGQIIEE
ncbi:MAG: hypothetical protein SFH39_13395 [Candidatus Magnetobacterium sp. LHC-1]|uniref:Zinc finger Ogr/Delta-type domain-containing protein n=1 Tax=Candidatus Magnetobacterium casense TaxID=1455061 RepID=A0ABS6S4F3_9BACT|nr:hypothetical protein [Candidatus Magnetobacterium casensis]MBF0608523.1 hypothetical protein [Nitrospirota bacterium]MBV6343736.1 hypothetical protein [Candidatus Magnetobacterium casensis]